jgi:thioredoxin 1
MLRRTRTSAVVVFLLAMAMIAAGCGGGDTGGTAGETTVAEGSDSGATDEGGTGATESGGTEATEATEAGGTRTIEATTVTDSTFDSDVLQAGRPVLVHFWAEWCGPCRKLSPVLEEVAGEHESTLTVARLNVDDNSETPGRLDVQSIPTLVLFVDGTEKKRFTGNLSKDDIDSGLAEFVG